VDLLKETLPEGHLSRLRSLPRDSKLRRPSPTGPLPAVA
jgi:hypothetical protein